MKRNFSVPLCSLKGIVAPTTSTVSTYSYHFFILTVNCRVWLLRVTIRNSVVACILIVAHSPLRERDRDITFSPAKYPSSARARARLFFKARRFHRGVSSRSLVPLVYAARLRAEGYASCLVKLVSGDFPSRCSPSSREFTLFPGASTRRRFAVMGDRNSPEMQADTRVINHSTARELAKSSRA